MSLFLLRHGETEYSRQDRFCGNIDAELTGFGHEMARCFAEAHSTLLWQAIYTSTRERAIRTASPLATRTGITIDPVPELDEIHYGDWQGRSKDEIAMADPDRYRRWLENPTIGAPGGESAFDVAKRALALIDLIRARHDDGNVLIVGHKTVLRIAICLLTGMELRRYRELPQPVAALTIADVRDGGPALRLLANNSYLPDHLRSDDTGQGAFARVHATAGQSQAA
ncbi:MAG TPA: histidine phosphatase family protein [Polyangia bacterium]|nr:histidine phosphatase family protein [Polyangia bacterium]